MTVDCRLKLCFFVYRKHGIFLICLYQLFVCFYFIGFYINCIKAILNAFLISCGFFCPKQITLIIIIIHLGADCLTCHSRQYTHNRCNQCSYKNFQFSLQLLFVCLVFLFIMLQCVEQLRA